MGSDVSTKEKLLQLIDDFELIAKEFIENTIAMRHQKMTVSEHVLLTDLLIAKDKEIKETLALAKEQANIVKKMEALKAEVERHDVEIQSLQRQFKEAEQVLSTAIFQAQQKLASINKANKRPVMSEQLIKFAYGISASNAVCAPLNFQQGDPRRPYPTDIKMRAGFLGRSEISHNGVGSSQNISELARPGQVLGAEPLMSQVNQFAWHPSGEIHMTVGGHGGSVAMDTRNHKDEDAVEVMSTDSSSSSSSDSQ